MPSKALLDASMLWIQGWGQDTGRREVIERSLLALKDEASQFVARSYGRFYRAQPISFQDLIDLKAGRVIDLKTPAVLSWTGLQRVADMFSEGGNSFEEMIVIAKEGLRPLLDVGRIGAHFDIEELNDPNETLKEMLIDVAREQEVLCESGGLLNVRPQDVLFYRDENFNRASLITRLPPAARWKVKPFSLTP